MYTQEITRLDGTPWLRKVCSSATCWSWITQTMRGLYDCAYDEISIEETEEHGDVLVVRGVAVGLLPVPKVHTRT